MTSMAEKKFGQNVTDVTRMQMQHKTTRHTIPFLVTKLTCHLLKINATLQKRGRNVND
jgi:hypothetical protein